DLKRKLTALGCELFMPVCGLEAPQPVGQDSVGKHSPHRAANKRAVNILDEKLLGWNPEAVGNNIDVCGRIADLDPGNGLFRGLPISKVVDLRQPSFAFVAAGTVEKIMTKFLRPSPDPHRIGKIVPNGRVVLPCVVSQSSAAVDPVPDRQRDQRLKQEFFECSPSRIRTAAVVKPPLTAGEQQSSSQQMGSSL